jgi:hypothetical protein
MGESMSGAFAIAYCLAAAAAASVVAWSRLRPTLPRVQLGILTLAGFMGLSYTGIVISMQARTSNDPSLAVLSVRDLIPPGERLLSFGPVHHLFAYYYQEPIELRKVSGGQAPTEFSNTYFCFVDDPFFETPEIPFAWNRVAEISCERFRSRHPLTKVVIGTRRGVATLSQARTATALVPSDQPRAVRTADYEEPIPPKQ